MPVIQYVSENQAEKEVPDSPKCRVDNGTNSPSVSFWSLEAQEGDRDISYVIDLLQQFSEKPPWDKVAIKSSDVKTLTICKYGTESCTDDSRLLTV